MLANNSQSKTLLPLILSIEYARKIIIVVIKFE